MEIFGMEVRVKLNVVNLKEVADQIRKNIQSITVKVKSEMQGFEGGVRGGVFGKEGGSVLGQMIGKLAFFGGVLTAIKMGIGSVVSILGEASPALKNVLNILTRAFFMFFKPFGDYLARMLLPLSTWLLRMAMGFTKWFNQQGKEAKGAMAGAVGGALAGAGVGGLAGGPVGALVGAGIGALAGGILGALSQVDWNAVGKSINDFVTGIFTAFSNPTEMIKGFGTLIQNMLIVIATALGEAWTGFVEWTKNALPAFATWLGEQMGRGLGLLIKFISQIGQWVWDIIVSIGKTSLEVLAGIGKWIWDTMVAFIKDPLGTLAGFGKWIFTSLTDALKTGFDILSGLGKWIVEAIMGVFSGLGTGFGKGFFSGLGIPAMQMGGEVSKTGLILAHAGERVIPASQAQSSGTSKTVVYRPTFMFTGSINRGVDIEDAVEASHRKSELNLRRSGLV